MEISAALQWALQLGKTLHFSLVMLQLYATLIVRHCVCDSLHLSTDNVHVQHSESHRLPAFYINTRAVKALIF